jgi:hypothetical protein
MSDNKLMEFRKLLCRGCADGNESYNKEEVVGRRHQI